MKPPHSGAKPGDTGHEPDSQPPVASLLQRESADLDVMSHPYGGVKVNVPEPPDPADPEGG